MGLLRSNYVAKPPRSDAKKNINTNLGYSTLDNVPFVYTMQINPGQFRIFALPYTVPEKKKVFITYMSLTSFKVNNQTISINGSTVLTLDTNDDPVAVSLTQPLEATEGQIIAHSEPNGAAAVAGFEIEF